MNIIFNTLSNGVEIVDPIERRREQILTSNQVQTSKGKKDHIPYPVDSAVQITTDRLIIPEKGGLYIGDCDGNYINKVSLGELLNIDDKCHIIDSSTSVKSYLHFNNHAKISSDSEYYYIDFPNPTQVTIGARSLHTRPANTIKVTDDPRDIMRAVSRLGSALKTLTVNKSFPTLRGHPPEIQIADELHIPDNIESPKSGIRIEIPPTLQYIYVAAPLAYYLGAKVVPGSSPQISTDRNYTHIIGGKYSFERSIQNLLEHIFFLDCVTRTVDWWAESLQERHAISELIDTSVSELYGLQTSERIEKYLQIPLDIVENYIPKWPVRTYLPSTPKSVELLPFIVSDLSAIRIREEKRSGKIAHINSADETEQPTAVQRWNGISDSDVVSSTPRSAFQNALDRSPQTGPIDIDIVCNDPEMNREFVNAYSTYGGSDSVPFDVTLHTDVTKYELESILARESDFFHYIGHIETDGFQCADGKIDAATIESVNAKAFFLNACQSHRQGLHLIEAGSLGGIVTAADVENRQAVSIGSTVAKLLNCGFPLYGAIDLARVQTTTAEQYHIVGDGKTVGSQGERAIASTHLISTQKEQLEIKHVEYVWKRPTIGGSNEPLDRSDRGYHIVPSNRNPVNISPEEFFENFGQKHIPIVLDGELVWSDEIKTTDLM